MKLFIATPAYDGKVHVDYTTSVLTSLFLLDKCSIRTLLCLNSSGSLLSAERNRLVHTFIESDCTHCLFVDSDVAWNAQVVKDFLDRNEDFLVGIYPNRLEEKFIFKPKFNEDLTLVMKDGLIEIDYAPAGFMMIKREVIEKMIEHYPNLMCVSEDPNFPACSALFNSEIWEGKFWGEDYTFCRRAREAGFKIYADPTVNFNHCGVVGRLSDFLWPI